MKQKLKSLLLQAVERLQSEGVLDNNLTPQINIERSRDSSHGDYATNLALILAKPAKSNPRQLAEKSLHCYPMTPVFRK